MHEEDRLRDWLEAERRVERETAPRQQLLTVIESGVLEDLRRAVGRPFQLRELVEHYDRGTDWAVDVATRIAPNDPWAWAPNLAIDAAFSRYARFARDVGGGRFLGGKRQGGGASSPEAAEAEREPRAMPPRRAPGNAWQDVV